MPAAAQARKRSAGAFHPLGNKDQENQKLIAYFLTTSKWHYLRFQSFTRDHSD
jgi:hypothetical protein